MNKKGIIIGVVVVLVIILVAVFNNSSRDYSLSGNIDNEVTLAALYPLSGGLASWGESVKGATDLAIDEINRNGGIGGKKVNVIYEDHKCDPKTALSVYESRLKDTRLFLSSSCSGTVISIAPNLVEDNSFLIPTVVASSDISNSSENLFRFWPVATDQSLVMAEDIKNNNYSKIGIIYEETDYAKGLKEGLEQQLADSNIEIVTEAVSPNNTDVRTQIAKLANTNLDAIFISPQTEITANAILSQSVQLGLNVDLYVNDIISNSPELMSSYMNYLEGAKGGSYLTLEGQNVLDFLGKYKALNNYDCIHENACAVAYDSVLMLSEALEKNKSIEGLRKYFEDVSYEGVSGKIEFNDKNDREGAGYSLMEIKNGKISKVQ